MQGLPSDVVLAILLKLAAQDPLSLLRATFACKSLFEVTESNPAIWREAFLAPYRQIMGAIRTEDMADLDARIGGGYKRLALVKAKQWQATKPGGFRTKQEQVFPGFEQIKKSLWIQGKRLFARGGALKPTRSVKMYVARLVVLFSLRGRLFCFTEIVPEEQSCCEFERDLESLFSSEATPDTLDFTFTGSGQRLLGATYSEMIGNWEKVTAGADGKRLVDDTISVEVYGNVTVLGRVSTIICKPVYKNCIVTCKDCKGIKYQFPACKVPLYCVPQGRHGFSSKGGQLKDTSKFAEAGQQLVQFFS